MSVGKAVLRIRQKQGLTQREVGLRARLATSYISRIENGHIQPTMTTLSRLARALEIPVAGIFQVGGDADATEAKVCPVTGSGECVGELIRSNRGREPGNGKARYGEEELRLLKMTDYLVNSGSKEIRQTLTVLLEALMTQAGRGGPRSRPDLG